MVRRSLGRLAIPAHGLIPPGLLGYSASGSSTTGERRAVADSDSSVEQTVSREMRELTAATHPIFFSEFAAFARTLTDAYREIGIQVKPANRTMEEYLEFERRPMSTWSWAAGRRTTRTPTRSCTGPALRDGIHGPVRRIPRDRRARRAGPRRDGPRVRHSIYRRVEDLITRDALMIPLFHDQVYCFAAPDVQGLGTLGSAPVVPYDALWIAR
jgi:hypothetical protein